MKIEQLVNFKKLTLRGEQHPFYQYSLVGSESEHKALPSGSDGAVFSTERIKPIGNPVIWQELLQDKELDTPQTCNICPTNGQVSLWRTFTKTSLKAFNDCQGVGKPLELDENDSFVSEGQTVYRKKSSDIEVPGYLWVARDVNLAIGVGLSRAIIADEPISLLGINACQCDLSARYKLYTTLPEGDIRYIEEVSPEEINHQRLFSEGEIITRIPLDKIDTGVTYHVALSFFDYIKNAAQDLVISELSLKRSCSFISGILEEIARQDPNIEKGPQFNTLPKTWAPFLQRIPNQVFSLH